MNGTPPEAKPEHSRASRAFRGAARAPRAVLAGAVLGALLLVAAELAPLYRENSAATRAALRTVRAGSHHGYALIPIGLLALVLALTAVRSGSRMALLALAALGVAAALVAVLADLPDAGATGLVGSAAGGYTRARDTPAAGLYLETLGAALLVLAGGVGLVLAGGPRRSEA